jgi:hypothetical protein
MWNRQREADQARSLLKRAETGELYEGEEHPPGWPTPLARIYTP